MTLINLPTVGGTLRKSRILHERDSCSVPTVQRDVTAQDGKVGQQILLSSLPLVNQGPSDDCTHVDFFSPSFFLANSQDHFTLWTKTWLTSDFGILIAAAWNTLDVLQDSCLFP